MTVPEPTPPRVLSLRASVAVRSVQAANWLSRTLGRGSGTVAGGRVGLALDPSLLATLATGYQVALVTGTNGKTTTTSMLAAALSGPGVPDVVSNVSGANMPAGHVAALAGARSGGVAVLEVDEGYLGRLIGETSPRVVVLLNLSRDQLDRISEVRMLVDRWRSALSVMPPRSGADGAGTGTVVVANADDPMVVWAAMAAADVRWVGAGQVWHLDAVGCPSCGGRIVFGEADDWSCERCPLSRPAREAWLEGHQLVFADGRHFAVDLGLPGQFNRANAAMVVVAALAMTPAGGGPDPADRGPSERPARDVDVTGLLARVASVGEVAGRYSSTVRGGHPIRLLLAKNPAGWTAIFDLLEEDAVPGEPGDADPVVLSVNARTADGFDTSWLWDVPFERLTGRSVMVTGERRLDLAVRLRYAGVEAVVVSDPVAAVDRAVQEVPDRAPPRTALGAARAEGRDGTPPAAPHPGAGRRGRVDVVANYTAFADLRTRM